MSEQVIEPPAVLVVDDNAQNRALVDAALEDEGYHVVLVASGEEAMAAFEAKPFDCVLLDVRMPGMSGFEVCKRLRAHPRGADVSIVFLTALRDVDTFDQARESGGDDFLTKPLRPAELLVRVRAALELRRLSAENRGYYATLREQRDAVMRLQLHKEQLTAFLVHDLRNPLNALDMHAQLLLRDKSISERSRASALSIRQDALRLGQLITNMLDLSRAEAGELAVRRSRVDLHALVRDVTTEFAVRSQDKGVTVTTQVEPLHVDGDLTLLRRLLENLLDNALRYAPVGSQIAVSVAAAGDLVELRVADEGPGIPAALRQSVFERFVQASDKPERPGYGLGLAFCKLAVTVHGGTIAVEDGAPGAVFCVRLPVKAAC